MELKQTCSVHVAQKLEGLNRTFMELKQGGMTDGMLSAAPRLNRTFMELKQASERHSSVPHASLNRTFMELKRKGPLFE